jgi:hypothetical protein
VSYAQVFDPIALTRQDPPIQANWADTGWESPKTRRDHDETSYFAVCERRIEAEAGYRLYGHRLADEAA